MAKDEIVKQDIIERAQVLFQQFGLKKTTMDKIAILSIILRIDSCCLPAR